MKQGVAIELVLLRVNGGELTDEGSVQRADIRAYLPVAINYVTSKAYYTNRKEEGDRDFPSSFYGTFDGIVIDRNGNVPIITLPKMVVDLPSNQGIRYITDDCGNTFTPLSDADFQMVNYYKNMFPGERFYRRIGLVVQLWNLSPLAKHINSIIMIDPTEFDDDTTLPIQAGMEQDVIDLCVQHFTAQRQQPADVVANKTDLNAQ